MLTFAFRNLMRHKKRTFLTALSVFAGAMFAGLLHGYVNGLLDSYINNYAKYQTGHVKITTTEYASREKYLPVDEYYSKMDELAERLQLQKEVSHVEQRIPFGILLGRGENTIEAVGMGIDLQKSRLALPGKIATGQLSDSGLYLGKDLAEKIGAAVGESLLLVTRTSEGGLNGIKLTVNGTFDMGMGMYNRKFFFTSLDDARRLLKIPSGSTELFIYTGRLEDSAALKDHISVDDPLVARSFREQLGGMAGFLDIAAYIYAVIEIVILFLACFVIINTMMMNIFERIREIGTMKALGFTDREVFLNFSLEGALIGTVAGLAGGLTGYGLVVLIAGKGIDMSAVMGTLEMPIEYIIKPRLKTVYLLGVILISIVVPALSAMVPARYTRRLTAAEALRK